MLARRHKNSGRAKMARTIVGHGKFVRGFSCMVEGQDCFGKVQACHVDFAGGKGMGLKVHDAFIVPMCAGHHLEQGRGWDSFITKHRLTHEGVLATAAELARNSPRIIRAAREAGHDVGQETEA